MKCGAFTRSNRLLVGGLRDSYILSPHSQFQRLHRRHAPNVGAIVLDIGLPCHADVAVSENALNDDVVNAQLMQIRRESAATLQRVRACGPGADSRFDDSLSLISFSGRSLFGS